MECTYKAILYLVIQFLEPGYYYVNSISMQLQHCPACVRSPTSIRKNRSNEYIHALLCDMLHYSQCRYFYYYIRTTSIPFTQKAFIEVTSMHVLLEKTYNTGSIPTYFQTGVREVPICPIDGSVRFV